MKRGTLRPFFTPKRIAVIGASRTKGKIGHAIFSALQSYPGKVIPVNPNAKKILGKTAYARASDIPKPVDLAVIAVPREAVIPVLEDLAGKTKHVIIITAGFAETGHEDEQEQLKHTLKKHGIRALGPNCLGILDTHNQLDTLFLPKLKRPPKGTISIISQSGALGSQLLDNAAAQSIGIARFISYGNALDINETDLLNELAAHKDTHTILAYIEGIHDGRAFMKAAKQCKKPLIILKGGLTEAGAEAAQSHTASLAGSARVYTGIFKQINAIHAETMSHAFDLLTLFNTPVRNIMPHGKNTLIITNGGGLGIAAADALSTNNIPLATLSTRTKKLLKKTMPEYANITNPLDLLGDADVARYEHALKAALKDASIHAIMLILLTQVPNIDIDEFIKKLQPLIKKAKKPILLISPILAEKQMAAPAYAYPEHAARALASYYDYTL